MITPINVAIASYGMSGQVFHAPLLEVNSGFQITAILERSKNLSRERYPNATIERSYKDLLTNPDVEMVVVNTPDHLHHAMAREALLAGKHVVVEKPFTMTQGEAEELIEIADKKGLTLSVFQNRRWDGDFMTVQSIMEQGLLGRLVSFESQFNRFRNYIPTDTWKEDSSHGTGLVYNLGSHLIDQALVLFGKPVSVFADIRTLRTAGQIDDSFDIWLQYPDTKVLLRSSYLVREPTPRFILHGTEGSYLKWGIDPQEEKLKAGELPNQPNWGAEEESQWGLLNTDVDGKHFRGSHPTLNGSYQEYYNNIFAAIREKTPLEVTPQQALLVIRVIEHAYISVREGRGVDI